MGLVAPVIFLSVAAFLLNVVLSRLISTQREQVAALKAFGYTRIEISFHYLGMVIGIVLVGVLMGSVAGVWLGRNLTAMYTRFYRFPIFFFHIDFAVVILAFLISAAAGILGTLGAVRKAMLLPPAEAMRPEPPAAYRPTLMERFGIGRGLSQTVRMILRQLKRQPVKALLSSFGISLAVAVMVLGSFGADAIDFLMDFQFQVAQR
jgi:putative ABC transport system permease protein